MTFERNTYLLATTVVGILGDSLIVFVSIQFEFRIRSFFIRVREFTCNGMNKYLTSSPKSLKFTTSIACDHILCFAELINVCEVVKLLRNNQSNTFALS